MVTNQVLHTFATKQLNGLQAKYRYLPFCDADWDDIKQEIMIRVFQKKNHLIDGKGYRGFIMKLINNAFKNYMRDTCGRIGKPDNVFAKYAVKFPQRMITKVVQDGMLGEETIYEPDLPASVDNISIESKQQVKYIIDMLPSDQKLIIETYEKAKSWDEAGKTLKLNGQTARKRYFKIINEIKEKMEII